MICGNFDANETFFKYRSSSYLTQFFQDCIPIMLTTAQHAGIGSQAPFPRSWQSRSLTRTHRPTRYHLHRTRFEQIAECKLRRRQLTEDANVEITGRDLRERSAPLGQGSLFGTERSFA
jgi:hypothetical protein